MRRLITGDWRDWLSVVCSCDLGHPVVGAGLRGARALRRCVFAVGGDRDRALGGDEAAFGRRAALVVVELPADLPAGVGAEIGRASCRERVWLSVGAGAVSKKEC